MKSITVFYDASCGMCSGFRRWLTEQPTFLVVRFLPYDGAEARLVFPEIDRYDPADEIVVLGDNGNIYQGGDAWIICLWATEEYREWANRMARPMLRPLVKRFCTAVSANRQGLSTLVPGKSDAEIERELQEIPECEDGTCAN